MQKIILDFFITYDGRKSSFVITRSRRSFGHGATCVSHGIYVETKKRCRNQLRSHFTTREQKLV
jgi:hypothetical protein